MTSESIFANKLVYGSVTPDNAIDNPYNGNRVKTLATKENVYAYMDNQSDASNPSNPLVFDNCTGSGLYTNAVNAVGSVWGGTKAICVRLDNSAALESLDTTTPTGAYIKGTTSAGVKCNLLDNSGSGNPYLSSVNKLLTCDGLQ